MGWVVWVVLGVVVVVGMYVLIYGMCCVSASADRHLEE